MIDPQGRVYGRVQIRRLNGEIRYRAELGAELLGWANSLKLATYRLHMAHLRQASGREGPTERAALTAEPLSSDTASTLRDATVHNANPSCRTASVNPLLTGRSKQRLVARGHRERRSQ